VLFSRCGLKERSSTARLSEEARCCPPDPKQACAFNNVSYLALFLECLASGMPIGRNVFLSTVNSSFVTGQTERRSTIRRVDFHSVLATTFIRTTRYLEQNTDEAVTLGTQQINNEDMAMDKDRIKGSAEQAKGAVKEAAGKVFGDKKLETEGKTDKAAGKVQNAVGGLKDAVRGK
jgi:uncharacterized protein YjbJ (UPF0337 family)